MESKFNGSFLRKKIGEASLTNDEFADKIGYARQSVQRWLVGAIPGTDAMMKISDYFDEPIENFLPNKSHRSEANS